MRKRPQPLDHGRNFLLSETPQKSAPRYRVWGRWALLGLAWAVAGAALLLGRAQLSLADESLALQAAIEARLQETELDTLSLLENPAAWAQMHQRVALEGFWLMQHTLLLESRDAKSRPGAWVMTPLQLDASTAVWVQRGWLARDAAQQGPWPEFQTEGGVVRLQGRVAPEPTPLVKSASDSVPSASGSSKIRQNLTLAQFREETGVQALAVVLQTDEPDEGLVREVPAPAAEAKHHQQRADQWFVLAALLALACVWLQWIRPLFHARRSSS